MTPQTEVMILGGVVVPLLLAAIPGAWRAHKYLARIESTLAIVESRSVQLTRNSGSHVADVPEAVKRVELKLDAVRVDALAAAEGVADKLAAEIAATNRRMRMEREQHAIREALGVLMSALEDYSRDEYRKEVAYVKALKHYNIDLTNIADHLESDAVSDDT